MLLLVLVLALMVSCTTAAPGRLLTQVPGTKPTATPVPTPVPTEEPGKHQPLPQSQPFAVAIDEVRVTSGSNGALFGVAPTPWDPAAATQAVDAAAAVLDRFLNAQFVDRDTYWSDAGVAVLLDPAAVDPATRQALGALDGHEVLGTVTGSASATADVVLDGSTLQAVTLTYATTLELILADGTGSVAHRGVITFTPLQGRLTLVGVQPTTTFAGDLQAVLS
ncbi:hypothetical protein BH23ACT9_BH23ACT9_30570 [soil metagenome]